MSRPLEDHWFRMMTLGSAVMQLRDLTNKCTIPGCLACHVAYADLDLPAVTSLPGSRDRKDAIQINLTLAVRIRQVAQMDGAEYCPAGRFAAKALKPKERM